MENELRVMLEAMSRETGQGKFRGKDAISSSKSGKQKRWRETP